MFNNVPFGFFRFYTAAHATLVHVQRQRRRQRVAAPPVVAGTPVVPVVLGHRGQQPTAHTDAVDQLSAEGFDRRPDAHRGGETHPVGRGLSDTRQVAVDQGGGEVVEEDQEEN